MKSKSIIIVVFSMLVTGCMTHAINAWKLSAFKKTLGTEDPSFILNHDSIYINSVRFHRKRHLREYGLDTCKLFNKDEQLSRLKKSGIIKTYPNCILDSGNGIDITVEVGTPKEKCIPFINCLDKYIKYTDGEGNVLAYSEMKQLPYMDGIRYSVGHIKNMVIAANIQANKDNPAWKENLERVCKEDKTLKSVCG